jgi:hypothetical protein
MEHDCQAALMQVALLLELLRDGNGIEADPNDVSPAEYRRVSATAPGLRAYRQS